MSSQLIQQAATKLSVILYPVRQITSWCILCTNSGGNARYWVVRGDDDQVYAWKLNKSETMEVMETVG